MTSYTDFKNRLGRNAESDECYTPINSLNPLLPFIDTSKTWYEACSGISSQMVDGFQGLGVDIRKSLGKDFFTCTSDDVYDGVITNPPYSIKDKFIEHCYNLGKPFALLLPVTAFQGQKRGTLFKQYGISALVYNSRVDFTGKGAPTFGVAWFMGNGFSDHMKGEDGRIWFV